MRWRRQRDTAASADTVESPVVLAVTSALTRQTARDLATRLEHISPGADVVIDLTGISGFDTDGTNALMRLQESTSHRRVSIVGLRQATARLVGDVEVEPSPVATREADWVVRHLRNLVVVQPGEGDGDPPTTDSLEPALTAAGETTAAIVVVDLRNVAALTAAGLHALTFASSSAALRGQELLVVNVSPQAAEALRTAGLSATTFVAPEPPLDNPPGLTW